MPRKALRRYVAFLRGINLGNRRVKMDDLRAHFEGLAFANVATFIASGNVIFDARAAETEALERRIEAHLGRNLGYEVDTFLRTPEALAAVAAFRPFAADELEAPGHTLHVAFLRRAPGETAGDALATFRTPLDDFRLHGSELYWLCRGKITESTVSWPRLSKAIGSPSTMRNVTTVRKLVAKYPAGA